MALDLSKLKKMKMPVGKDDMDMSEGSPAEEGSESPAEESAEGPNPELEKVSDDDLLAEMKRRGLDPSGKSMGEPDDDSSGSDQDMYS